MGLLTIIRKQKIKDKEIRVLMLGLDNAGKTTIVKSILGEDVRCISPTLGFNIRTIEHGPYKLNIWDVGGQYTLRPFWRNYFEKTDSLVWVVDASALDRLADCKAELDKVLNEDRLKGAGLLILVNKIDTLGEGTEEKEKLVHDVEEALDLKSITFHEWKVMGCSAFDGTNLKEAVDWIVSEVKSRLYLLDD